MRIRILTNLTPYPLRMNSNGLRMRILTVKRATTNIVLLWSLKVPRMRAKSKRLPSRTPVVREKRSPQERRRPQTRRRPLHLVRTGTGVRLPTGLPAWTERPRTAQRQGVNHIPIQQLRLWKRVVSQHRLARPFRITEDRPTRSRHRLLPHPWSRHKTKRRVNTTLAQDHLPRRRTPGCPGVRRRSKAFRPRSKHPVTYRKFAPCRPSWAGKGSVSGTFYRTYASYAAWISSVSTGPSCTQSL